MASKEQKGEQKESRFDPDSQEKLRKSMRDFLAVSSFVLLVSTALSCCCGRLLLRCGCVWYWPPALCVPCGPPSAAAPLVRPS